jgi:peptidoglycan/xylan/chitin deacetylase (PgdA/CDA1 family)
MGILHKIIPVAYHPLKSLKLIGSSVGLISSSLRVLIYHDIPEAEYSNFRDQLLWLKKTWNFVSPGEFELMISGDMPIIGNNLLLTFDDGFVSNRFVAETILRDLGIKAVFFIISDFVGMQNRGEAKQFICKNILPGRSVNDIPDQLYNMSWDDLLVLLEQGHTVGAHTASHARLSDIENDDELFHEIVDSADAIASRLGVSIDHFAYTFGDLASFSPKALEIASNRFRFVYSGLRGNNSKAGSPFTIRRDAVQTYDSIQHVGVFLEGISDIYYARECKRLDQWVPVKK